MPFLSGKQAFLQILKQEGVECMFGNPGTTELPLMDGLAREPGIRYVLALQESVAIASTHMPRAQTDESAYMTGSAIFSDGGFTL